MPHDNGKTVAVSFLLWEVRAKRALGEPFGDLADAHAAASSAEPEVEVSIPQARHKLILL